MQTLALQTCFRTSLTTTASAQTTAAAAATPADIPKPPIATKPKPDLVPVPQFLKASIPSILAQYPAVVWDEVFTPRKELTPSKGEVTRTPPAKSEPKDPIGTKFDVRAVLGRGSYGKVYSAVERETGREVAIKEIPRRDGCCTVSECKLQQEVNALGDLLGCSSVVQMLGYYVGEEKIYIVTELCKGGDLEDYLKSNGPLNDEHRMALVAVEALKMLTECHAKKMVHGDIKPANFVISTQIARRSFMRLDGPLPSGWLKGIDLGTSQYIGKGRCTAKVGTPTHWPPEVFAASYGREADLWGLGVMLYRLMTGRLPFWDNYQESQLKSEQDVLKGVIYTRPDFASEPWCRSSQECVDFMRALLDPNYETRLTAEAALNHPFIARHVKKEQRLGFDVLGNIVLPSAMMEAYPALV